MKLEILFSSPMLLMDFIAWITWNLQNQDDQLRLPGKVAHWIRRPLHAKAMFLFQKSFFNRTTNSQNVLPTSVRSLASVLSFYASYKQYHLALQSMFNQDVYNWEAVYLKFSTFRNLVKFRQS